MTVTVAFRWRGGKASVKSPKSARLSLLALAQKGKVPLKARCGGLGSCGACLVELGPGKYQICGVDREVAPGEKYEALACQSYPLSNASEVYVTDRSLSEVGEYYADSQARNLKLPAVGGTPRVQRVAVTVPPATIDAPSSAAERVGNFEFNLERLQQLPELLLADEETPLDLVTSAADDDGRPPLVLVAQRASGGPKKAVFGVAIDVGTTTVAVALVDLVAGKVVDVETAFNQQLLVGDDVISRISYCRGDGELKKLQHLVTRYTINPLISELCSRKGLAKEDLLHVVVAGNTVMSHLFLGLSPEGIGRAPFSPVARNYPVCRAASLGLAVNPVALVEVVPAVSGYVGGDITAGAAMAELARRSGLWLFVDIGTNGEMVLADRGNLLACATAAGPVFEGAGLFGGMRAVEGAIEHLNFGRDLDWHWQVLGGAAPRGLCGSAAIDFVAQGWRCGLLNEFGRMDCDLLKLCGRYTEIEWRGNRVVGAKLAGEGLDLVVVTERDVAELLKAKAAIAAGMKTLLSVAGRRLDELDGVLLAGGFAGHIDLANAMAIGLLPNLPIERYQYLGNTSLIGAAVALLDSRKPTEYRQLSEQIQVVELNLRPEFVEFFSSSLVLGG